MVPDMGYGPIVWEIIMNHGFWLQIPLAPSVLVSRPCVDTRSEPPVLIYPLYISQF